MFSGAAGNSWCWLMVGLSVILFQAMTQIQEQSLALGPKILAVVAMLLGRLEIFPPLTIVLPSFWLQRSRRVLGLRRRSKE